MQPRLLMTVAMAFFSIALTLNITGFTLTNVHVTAIKLSDLRPRTVRAYLERQWTMASVPIVRYYDHLRFVYEVESRVRALRGQAESEGNGGQQRNDEQQPKPGETKKNPGNNDGGFRTDPQQEPGNPAMEPAAEGSNELLECSLTLQEPFEQNGAAGRAEERSTVWIA